MDAQIFEAESRLELALHYNIAYPRHYNLPPGTTVNAMKKSRAARGRKTQTERLAESAPRYMDSYYEDGVPTAVDDSAKR